MATVQDLLKKVKSVAGVLRVDKVDERDLIAKYGRKDYFYAVTYQDPNDPERVVVQNFVISEYFTSTGKSKGAYFTDKPAILNPAPVRPVSLDGSEILATLSNAGLQVEGVNIDGQTTSQDMVSAEVSAYVLDSQTNTVTKKRYFFKKVRDANGNESISYFELV